MQPWTRLPSQARTSLLLGSLGFGHSCPAAHPASSHPDQGLSAQTCKAQGSLYWCLLSPVLGTCLPPALVRGRLSVSSLARLPLSSPFCLPRKIRHTRRNQSKSTALPPKEITKYYYFHGAFQSSFCPFLLPSFCPAPPPPRLSSKTIQLAGPSLAYSQCKCKMSKNRDKHHTVQHSKKPT